MGGLRGSVKREVAASDAVEEGHEDAPTVPQREEPEARDAFGLPGPLDRLADRRVVVASAGWCRLDERLESIVAAAA